VSGEPRPAVSIRCFVALDLEPELREHLARVVESLRTAFAGLRLVRPDGTHLTLRFLGASSPGQLERLGPVLAAAAAASAPMDAGLLGLDTFPARGSPRVLHLAVEAQASLMALQSACEAAARTAGYAPETRAFHPHLTLGRWRERVPRPPLPSVTLPDSMRLSTLTLFRSETRPEGAVYTALGRFPLGGTAPS